jgi:predicted N-acetyltransferase YhbS
MALLAVRPSHQRLGLGSLLLTPVLKQADVEGAKVFVQASKEGMGLYARFGWEEVDEVVIDFSAYGGEKVKTALMIRDPEPRKAKKEL